LAHFCYWNDYPALNAAVGVAAQNRDEIDFELLRSFLMNAAAEWVRERRCRTIELHVFEFNLSALRLYESLGYETVSRRLKARL